MTRETHDQTEPSRIAPDPNLVWWKDKEVAAHFGISRNRVWAWVRQGRLPKPVKLGPNTSRWHVDVLNEWEAFRNAEAS